MTPRAGFRRPNASALTTFQGVLGRGGMGLVYRARDPRLGRDVAVKVIHRDSEGDRRWRQRFADEARAAAALNHPSIVAIYDVAIDVDSPYIVSELIDGVSLRDELKRGPMRLPRLLDAAVQIADGLTAAHQAGLVHRDLKPENVMSTSTGRVKIVDFGLAKPEGRQDDNGTTRTITAPHTIVGTPAYTSPEQARREAVDFRSALFSFGAVLYEMLTGRLAFDRTSSIDTLSAILHDEPRPLGEIAQHVPADLHRIVERCLAKRRRIGTPRRQISSAISSGSKRGLRARSRGQSSTRIGRECGVG
jgi:serine/threonine protein kinase